MRKLIYAVILCLGSAAFVHAQEAQPVQVFACKLNEGKNFGSVMDLAEAYRTAWGRMDNPDKNAGAFIWTPFRQGSDYDYIVGFINSSLSDMVAGLKNYYGSGLGAGLDAQFTATGDCISAIMFSEEIKDGTIGQTADDQPDAMVELFACTLNEGSDMDDVAAAEEFWRKQVADLNSDALNEYEVYRWTPYRGGTGQADFLWVGNYPDIDTWAAGEDAYMGSKQQVAADERFEKVTTCTSGLWNGFWIVPPAAGPTAQ